MKRYMLISLLFWAFILSSSATVNTASSRSVAPSDEIIETIGYINNVLAHEENEACVLDTAGNPVQYVELMYNKENKKLKVRYFNPELMKYRFFPKEIDFKNYQLFEAVREDKVYWLLAINDGASNYRDLKNNSFLCLNMENKLSKSLNKMILGKLDKVQDLHNQSTPYFESD